MMKESSSKWTLCNPPVLFQVTMSPRLTVTSVARTELELTVTVWFAASGGADRDGKRDEDADQKTARPHGGRDYPGRGIVSAMDIGPTTSRLRS